MKKIRDDQRIDALHSEANVILTLHNYFIAYNETSLEISQEKFADFLEMGERTVRRITKRLVDMGRLNRAKGKGRSNYIYTLPTNAVTDIMEDILYEGNLFPIYGPKGQISLAYSFDDLMSLIDSIEQNKN